MNRDDEGLIQQLDKFINEDNKNRQRLNLSYKLLMKDIKIQEIKVAIKLVRNHYYVQPSFIQVVYIQSSEQYDRNSWFQISLSRKISFIKHTQYWKQQYWRCRLHSFSQGRMEKVNWFISMYESYEKGKNKIGNRGCQTLSLAKWPQLTQLILSLNLIHDAGCCYLTRCEWKNLLILKIESLNQMFYWSDEKLLSVIQKKIF